MAELTDILAGTAFNIKRTIEDLSETGNTDTLTSGAAPVPYPCDGSAYIFRTNGALYDETTGEVDCSGFTAGTALFLKWTANANSANPAGATMTVEVVIPDGVSPGVDVVAYSKDYVMGDATPINISNSTVFYISDLAIANNLRLQLSCTSNNVEINDRSMLTVH